MKKIISALVLVSFLVGFSALPMMILNSNNTVLAATVCGDYGTKTLCIDDASSIGPCYWDTVGTGVCKPGAPEIDVMTALQRITNWLFAILMVIVAMFLVIAGIQYISAQGDPEKIKSAHQKVLYSLIGVVVALLARGLVTLMEKIIGGY